MLVGVKGALVCCVLKCLRGYLCVCEALLRRQHLLERVAALAKQNAIAAILHIGIDHPDPHHLTSDLTLGVCVRSSTRTTGV